jgi:hypothetical protein
MINAKPCPPDELPSTAYKVCHRHFVGPFSKTLRCNGVWMKAEHEPAKKVVISYRPGFHVFPVKKDAEMYAQTRLPLRIKVEAYVTEVKVKGPAHVGLTYVPTCGNAKTFSVDKIYFPARS